MTKVRIQISVQKSIHASKSIVAHDIVDKMLGIQELVRFFKYKIEGSSCIFYNNKSVITVIYCLNIVIKKRITALAFHRIREAIAASAMEL